MEKLVEELKRIRRNQYLVTTVLYSVFSEFKKNGFDDEETKLEEFNDCLSNLRGLFRSKLPEFNVEDINSLDEEEDEVITEKMEDLHYVDVVKEIAEAYHTDYRKDLQGVYLGMHDLIDQMENNNALEKEKTKLSNTLDGKRDLPSILKDTTKFLNDLFFEKIETVIGKMMSLAKENDYKALQKELEVLTTRMSFVSGKKLKLRLRAQKYRKTFRKTFEPGDYELVKGSDLIFDLYELKATEIAPTRGDRKLVNFVVYDKLVVVHFPKREDYCVLVPPDYVEFCLGRNGLTFGVLRELEEGDGGGNQAFGHVFKFQILRKYQEKKVFEKLGKLENKMKIVVVEDMK